MNKQTAVEWLVDQIKSDQNQKALSAREWMQVIEQAKQMEKEQLAQAWDDGNYNYFYNKESGEDFENGMDYYNELYKE